jgi:hemerythrin-like domain-containing protein
MFHAAVQIIREDHSALTRVMRSLLVLLDRGPGNGPERFFDVLRAMLFYIDEFPERLHHPKESALLFPKLGRAAPELLPIIRRLEADHMKGEGRVRELQHSLLAWELLGESRRDNFVSKAQAYVNFYVEHMHTEETQLLPVALRVLSNADWAELDAAFSADRDPLASGATDPNYYALFTRIVLDTSGRAGMTE